MIRIQLTYDKENLTSMLSVGTLTAPPCVIQLDCNKAGINVPHEELHTLVSALNMGIAAVELGFAQANLKDMKDKEGVLEDNRIVLADASALKEDGK